MPKYKNMDELADAILYDVVQRLGEDAESKQDMLRYEDPDGDAHDAVRDAVDSVLESSKMLNAGALLVVAHEMGLLDEILGKHVEIDELDDYVNSLDPDERERVLDEFTYHSDLKHGVDELTQYVESNPRWRVAVGDTASAIQENMEYRKAIGRYYDSTRL